MRVTILQFYIITEKIFVRIRFETSTSSSVLVRLNEALELLTGKWAKLS